MSAPVTPQFLLEGAIYALEQCGLLLRDANIMFQSRSYASVVVLAAFAHEELGRSCILLGLRREVIGGTNFTRKEIQKRCKDHKTKQRMGMGSVIITDDSDLAEHLQTMAQSPPHSAEWQNTNEKINRMIELEGEGIPDERHKNRQLSLYVQPASEEDQWNRPVNTSPSDAHKFLRHAVGTYVGRYENGYSTSTLSILKVCDPELHNALEQWPDRPELPRPEWPPCPDAA
jgi:AbiV family abortive infection protein